jgi:hypothetical protein
MHPSRRWRALRSRARSPRMHHASYPVFVHRPAALDWASSRPRLATTPLPFSLPSALRKPGHRTSTYEVTRHARRTRRANRRCAASSRSVRPATSRRQGQGREDLSGGSRSAKVRGDGQKLHRRPGLRASWHPMTKPTGYGGQGKCSACARKHRVLTWGDLIGKRLPTFRISSGDRCSTE